MISSSDEPKNPPSHEKKEKVNMLRIKKKIALKDLFRDADGGGYKCTAVFKIHKIPHSVKFGFRGVLPCS